MNRAHRLAFWLCLLALAAVLALIASDEPRPWPSGDGDRVEVTP